MIRVYFDWNIISNLKKENFRDIRKYITMNKEHLLIPYSQAHFTDLMKSYYTNNKYFDQDLKMLESLCGKHLLARGNYGVKPLFALPTEYFKIEKNKDNITNLMDINKLIESLDPDLACEIGLKGNNPFLMSHLESTKLDFEITEENRASIKKMFPNITSESSILDLIKDFGPFAQKLISDKLFFLDFRKDIKDQGYNVDSNSGNWTYDSVIENIDTFLNNKNLGSSLNFRKFVEMSFGEENNTIDCFDYYLTAYLLLDMLGYKPDKLKKSGNNYQNIIADAEHSFYASHCEYLVTDDKNLAKKSRVLYNEYNLKTKIIRVEELIPTLSDKIERTMKKEAILENIISFCNNDFLIAVDEKDEENETETFVFKLPTYHFNYYNYLIQRYYPNQNIVVFTFKQDVQGFTNFQYFTELGSTFDSVTSFFEYPDDSTLRIKRQKFVYSDENVSVNWTFQGLKIILDKDEVTKKPVLTYFLHV